jgi:hypothetical protein
MSDEKLNDIALAFSEGKKEGMEEAGERIFNAILNWGGVCPNCNHNVDLLRIAKDALIDKKPPADPQDFF